MTTNSSKPVIIQICDVFDPQTLDEAANATYSDVKAGPFETVEAARAYLAGMDLRGRFRILTLECEISRGSSTPAREIAA